jgi:hypothetical protein
MARGVDSSGGSAKRSEIGSPIDDGRRVNRQGFLELDRAVQEFEGSQDQQLRQGRHLLIDCPTLRLSTHREPTRLLLFPQERE